MPKHFRHKFHLKFWLLPFFLLQFTHKDVKGQEYHRENTNILAGKHLRIAAIDASYYLILF